MFIFISKLHEGSDHGPYLFSTFPYAQHLSSVKNTVENQKTFVEEKEGKRGGREKRRSELIIYTMAKVHIPAGIQLLSHAPTYQGCF